MTKSISFTDPGRGFQIAPLLCIFAPLRTACFVTVKAKEIYDKIHWKWRKEKWRHSRVVLMESEDCFLAAIADRMHYHPSFFHSKWTLRWVTGTRTPEPTIRTYSVAEMMCLFLWKWKWKRAVFFQSWKPLFFSYGCRDPVSFLHIF